MGFRFGSKVNHRQCIMGKRRQTNNARWQMTTSSQDVRRNKRWRKSQSCDWNMIRWSQETRQSCRFNAVPSLISEALKLAQSTLSKRGVALVFLRVLLKRRGFISSPVEPESPEQVTHEWCKHDVVRRTKPEEPPEVKAQVRGSWMGCVCCRAHPVLSSVFVSQGLPETHLC